MSGPAAVLAALVLGGVGAVQLGVAAGAPWGSHVWGGSHPGRLPAELRLASGLSAGFLVLVAVVVLARGGAIGWSPLPEAWLGPATWIIAVLLAVNTLGNLSSKSRIERAGFGGATALLVVLCVFVAATGRGPQ